MPCPLSGHAFTSEGAFIATLLASPSKASSYSSVCHMSISLFADTPHGNAQRTLPPDSQSMDAVESQLMIEQLKIEITEVNRILGLEEGHNLDLKRAEIMPAKLTQSVSAFANVAGGEPFIGIEENDSSGVKNRRWRGFADIEEANQHIAAIEAMSPVGTHYRPSFLTAPGHIGHVLHLIVFKTRDILLASDGFAYVRRGAQKQAVKKPFAGSDRRPESGHQFCHRHRIYVECDSDCGAGGLVRKTESRCLRKADGRKHSAFCR